MPEFPNTYDYAVQTWKEEVYLAQWDPATSNLLSAPNQAGEEPQVHRHARDTELAGMGPEAR